MSDPSDPPEECGECGVIHRPGENTLCPGWRPGPYVAEPDHIGEMQVRVLGVTVFVRYLRRVLAGVGLAIVPEAIAKAIEALNSDEVIDLEGSDSQRVNDLAAGIVAVRDARTDAKYAKRGKL